MGICDNRTVLITGAGGGLGRAYALAFAAEGANVVVNDIRAEAARAVADEVLAAGGKAVTDSGDITTLAGAQAIVDAAVATFGEVHVLVNNAGVLRDRMNFNMAEDEFDLVLKVHCKGHFAMTRHACARWRELAKQSGKTYGRIINTSSEAGLMGSAGNSNYAMAKAAIAAMTISIGREMERYGVTANFIAPRARTRMTDTMPNSSMFDKPETGFDAFHPAWPAQLVVFLASEAAGDFTGQGFVVWGGEVMLVGGWHILNQISKPNAAFTAADLIARKDELFGAHPKQPGYM